MTKRSGIRRSLTISSWHGCLTVVMITALCLVTSPLCAGATGTMQQAPPGGEQPWWIWPVILLAVTFVMGIVAVLAGIGGGVLFVPLISSFFPFHLDFVRCAGLLVALTGALAAGPGLLRMNLASLRLAVPMALIASASSIAGAVIGLTLPTSIVRTALGVAILAICVIMTATKKLEYPPVPRMDRLASTLRICGIYREMSTGEWIDWQAHRTPMGLFLFILVGFCAGMFGLGAGWANVPVLNIVMGVPLKISVATSKFLLSVTDTSAAWIYINRGCILPLIAIPSIVGIMLGSLVGVRLLTITRPVIIRWIVIVVLAFAGCKTLAMGLGF